MEVYRGYIINTEISELSWWVFDGERALFEADSYDEALDWIDLYIKTKDE